MRGFVVAVVAVLVGAGACSEEEPVDPIEAFEPVPCDEDWRGESDLYVDGSPRCQAACKALGEIGITGRACILKTPLPTSAGKNCEVFYVEWNGIKGCCNWPDTLPSTGETGVRFYECADE